jgi:hypothetical protein
MQSSFDARLLVTILVVVLICGAAGCILMAAGFARRGSRARSGAIMGAALGAAIGSMLIGAIDIAASTGVDRINERLFGVGSVGLGLVMLLLLRLFGTRERKTSGDDTSNKDFSQWNLPIAKPKQPVAASKKLSSKKIFLSYRREDSADATGRIYDHLAGRYERDSIFKDVDSIPFGVDFRKHLQTVIETCEVVLVIIGDRWLTIPNEGGQRRLEDPADFVRIEVEAALQRDIPIIPILVNGAVMPRPQDLPEPMQELAYRNGLPVRHDPDFHNDLERLVKSLEQN